MYVCVCIRVCSFVCACVCSLAVTVVDFKLFLFLFVSRFFYLFAFLIVFVVFYILFLLYLILTLHYHLIHSDCASKTLNIVLSPLTFVHKQRCLPANFLPVLLVTLLNATRSFLPFANEMEAFLDTPV